MRYTIAAASLFAAVMAVPAVQYSEAPASTYTAWSTDVETITSCGPEVTNCPARSHSSTVAVDTTCTDSESSTWATSAPVSSAPASTWSSSAAVETTCTDSESSTWATSVAYSSGPASTWSSAPAYSTGAASSSSVWYPASSPVSPGPVSVKPAPYPVSSSPVTTVAPSGYASGTGAGPKPTGVPYTGAASSIKAAGAMVGAGAIAAFFL